MITLLDVNVLIALVDAGHIHHHAAQLFFPTTGAYGWASCPLTENAALRILGRPGACHGLDSPTSARIVLRSLLASPGHQFWPDDVSLMDTSIFPALSGSRHLTDLYLLALAVKHGGRLATFDTSIDASLIPGGPQALHLIPVL
jgi:toxin-antitoxin system PIN domain toxin